MPLSPQEQAELDQLNSAAGSGNAPKNTGSGGLSAEEQAELAQLNHAAGVTQAGAQKPAASDDMPDYAKTGPNADFYQKEYDFAQRERQRPALERILLPHESPGTEAQRNPMLDGVSPGTSGAMGAGSTLAKYMLGRLAGGVGTAAVSGAMHPTAKENQTGETDVAGRLDNAKTGMKWAGALGVGAEALNGALQAGNYFSRKLARFNPNQAKAYQADPEGVHEMAGMLDDQKATPQLQDQAVDAINNSRKAMRVKGFQNAQQLRELLTGKQVTVDASQLDGFSPEIDEAIAKARAATPSTLTPEQAQYEAQRAAYGRPTPPSPQVQMDANDANNVKRILQGQAQYQPGTPTQPVQPARQEQAANLARALRGSIEQLDPAIAPLNQEMQQGSVVNRQLRLGAKTSPLAFVSTEAPDRVATLARAEKLGEGGLLDFGNKYGAAKQIAMKDIDDAMSRMAERSAGRAGLRATQSVRNVVGEGSTGLAAIMAAINANARPGQK